MRPLFLAIPLLLGVAAPAPAQVSVGIGIRAPGVSLSINLPAYPDLVLIPDSPVYYAPGLSLNFFFYDGLYWVYDQGYWYSSPWYNGPWDWVDPLVVPVFILRIPVRYYRVPPPAFARWWRDEPPHWGEHWGHDWERHRSGWDRWDRRVVPAPAPLPLYQRHYYGERYPRLEQQRELRREHYRYQPHDTLVREREQDRERYREQERERPRVEPRPPAPPLREPQLGRPNGPAPQDERRPAPPLRREEMPRPAAPPEARPQPQRELQRDAPRAYPREQPALGRGQGAPRERAQEEERQRPRERERER